MPGKVGIKLDRTGLRYGHCVVLGPAPNHEIGKQRKWICLCDCGKEFIAQGNNLTSGNTTSCGCQGSRHRLADINRTHGVSDKDPRYQTWIGMKMRCTNPKNKGYRNYGGRGIKVCDEWLHDFQSFYDWANANGWEEGLTIERIDVNGDYCPENCTWIPKDMQARNRRTTIWLEYDGKCMTASEWADELGIQRQTLLHRYYAGWSTEDMLTKPVEPYNHILPQNGIEWNGEKKSIAAWARQYGLKEETVACRLRRGMTLEEALTKPVSGPTHMIAYKGEVRTIVSWAKEYGLDPNTVKYRLSRGYTIEEALTTPSTGKALVKTYNIGGVEKTLTEWCKEYGKKYTTVKARLDRGMSLEDALKTELKKNQYV